MTRSLSSLALLATTSTLALGGCHTYAPTIPATPYSSLSSKYWLVDQPMPVYTTWETRCVRKSVAFGRKDLSKDEQTTENLMFIGGVFFPPLLLSLMTWDTEEVSCDGQTYKASIRCTRSCDAPHGAGAMRLAARGSVDVTVREPGPTWISLELDNVRTKQKSESALEVVIVDPRDIDLECFDPESGSYAPCAERALDPAHPFIRAAHRGQAFRTEVDPEMPAAGALAVRLDEGPAVRAKLSLVEAMKPATASLSPGTYTVELRVRNTSYTPPVILRRQIRVAQGAA